MSSSSSVSALATLAVTTSSSMKAPRMLVPPSSDVFALALVGECGPLHRLLCTRVGSRTTRPEGGFPLPSAGRLGRVGWAEETSTDGIGGNGGAGGGDSGDNATAPTQVEAQLLLLPLPPLGDRCRSVR